jgi:PhzF family phenazine biosynthesis protein
MSIPYYHVDAFTGKIFAGNPAGVCILSAFLAGNTMQKIAAENKHCQTAFVVLRADGDFDLRWFTPEVEDDLCGHATLASAFVLALRGQSLWPVRFHTRSGVLIVTRDRESFEMDFPSWPPEPCEPPVELLPALGLKKAQVMRSRDYLVVVDRAEQVRALSPDIRALANWISDLAERLLPLLARATWTTCRDFSLPRWESMRIRLQVRRTAPLHPTGPIASGNGGCTHNN